MSATQPQTDRENLIAFLFGKTDEERKEANRLIRHYHSKPIEELSAGEIESLCLMISMNRKKRKLMRQIETEPQPGYCFNCGEKLMREDAIECRACHEGITDKEISYSAWQNRRGRI